MDWWLRLILGALAFALMPAAAYAADPANVAACDKGDGDACHELGLSAEDGEGVPQDFAAAASFYRRGCDLNDGGSCGDLATLYANGNGVPQDWAKVLALASRACTNGQAFDCIEVGDAYARGKWTAPHDPDQARQWFDRGVLLDSKACDRGDADACGNLGLYFSNGQFWRPDPEAARKWRARAEALRQPACSGGDGAACVKLADAAEHGVGRPMDLDAAASLYATACSQGQMRGCLGVGLLGMDDHPRGVSGEAVIAALTRACADPYPSACAALGDAAMSGRFGTPDPAAAMRWYKIACPQGGTYWGCQQKALGTLRGIGVPADPAEGMAELALECSKTGGCFLYGRAFLIGEGGTTDHARARSVFGEACKRFDRPSCYALSAMLAKGFGGPTDLALAKAALAAACTRGPVRPLCQAEVADIFVVINADSGLPRDALID